MGCGSSGGSKDGHVPSQRRRLSVGHAEGGKETGAIDEGKADEDRGIITELNDETVLTLAGEEGRKMSIGSQTDQGKTSFANKTIQQIGAEFDPKSLGLGYTCRKGLKPEAPNQDSWTIIKLEKRSIYAVFDGHGQKGHDVSNFVKENLPKLIIRDQRFKSNVTEDVKSMLIDSFKKVQSLVSTSDRMKKLSAQMSGTTATLCLHDTVDEDTQKEFPFGKLTIAHVADSTSVLGSKDGAKHKANQLTRDHKPNLKDERARIESNGGRVVFDGYANHRVYAKNARYPGLNMSRCLGDLMGHQDCGLSCEPEVKEVKLTAQDSVLLVCSDGVWEFMSAQEAIDLVVEALSQNTDTMTVAEKLAKEAWDRWIREEGGAVVDDITVVLICLAKLKKDN